LFYWTAFSNSVIHATPKWAGERLIKYRKNSNPPLSGNEPYTSIIEGAAFQHLIDTRTAEDTGLITKFAVLKDSYGLICSIFLGAVVASALIIIELFIL
jgi:hypothetical protein